MVDASDVHEGNEFTSYTVTAEKRSALLEILMFWSLPGNPM